MRLLLSTMTCCALALAVSTLPAAATGDTTAATETQPSAPRYRVVKVSAHDVLNVRHGPSSRHDIVGQVPAEGSGITMTGNCQGQWCPVRYAALEGWVFKAYLTREDGGVQAASTPHPAAAQEQPSKTPPAQAARAASPPEQAFRYFVAQGWGEHHAAGIVGNLQAECGHALNCSNGSGGLAQWRGDRVSRFHKVFGYPFARAKFADQLAYIHWELTHPASPWRDSGHALRRANDAGAAAALFDTHYERSSGSTRGARMANARALLKRFGNRTVSSN